jgi:CubicO group peptidase (beta-lactamase class C family)
MKNAVEKSEVRLLAALIAGLLNGSVVAASLSDVHVLRDESRCAVEKCARIFEGEMRDGVIHGAVVVAGGVNGSDVVASWGWADAAHAVPMTPSTVIDMASVTKTAAGVTACLVAHYRGLMDFDAPFTNYLSSYAAPLPRNITVRDIANHVSGFGEADGAPRVYFDSDAGKMLGNVLSMPPALPKHGEVKYSCRNYILLGRLFESVAGCEAEDFCRREIFAPAGMKDTSLGAPNPAIGKGRLAQTMGTDRPGVISDFVARPLWAKGIGTFNAGLFSTAEDIARLLRIYLRGGVCDDGTRIFGEREMKQIAPVEGDRTEGARRFGWQYATKDLPEQLSGSALFHSGWSGQTVLFDLRKQRYAVVLTTRCGDYARAKKDRFAAVAALLCTKAD